jgi:hypothetical protein
MVGYSVGYNLTPALSLARRGRSVRSWNGWCKGSKDFAIDEKLFPLFTKERARMMRVQPMPKSIEFNCPDHCYGL